MDYALISKTGTRDNNEDSVAAKVTGAGSLFVVADGLGGHGKGEVASSIATDTFVRFFSEYNGDMKDFIPEAFLAAQADIVREQESQRASQEMKTTCAALLISGNTSQIGHVGDTRVYVFQRNKILRRTHDHSVAELLVVTGEIKEKRIRHHPDRNRLLRTMGITWESPQYEISDEFHLAECQAFLLCTDGFWELCNERKMCVYLKKSKTASEWLALMIGEVESNGNGKDMDNYSAIAVIT